MRVERPRKKKVMIVVLPHVGFALQSDDLIFGPIFKLTCVILSYMQTLLLRCLRQIFLMSIYLLDLNTSVDI